MISHGNAATLRIFWASWSNTPQLTAGDRNPRPSKLSPVGQNHAGYVETGVHDQVAGKVGQQVAADVAGLLHPGRPGRRQPAV